MAMIDGVNYTEIKVLFDKDTRYLMYADSNGKLFYMNNSGELREWCRVFASGRVEQMTTSDVVGPGGELPFCVIGDNDQPGYIGNPNVETNDQKIVDKVVDDINRVIPDDSPRVSELTMLGNSSSYDGTYLSDNTYINEIYVDTSGRLYAKVDGGYVALYGVYENGVKAVAITKIIGDNSFYKYLNDYDLYSALDGNVVLLKAKDGSGFYLFNNGELLHISNLYGDGTYVGYSSGHIKDDVGEFLPYSFEQINKGRVDKFFYLYNLDRLSVKSSEDGLLSGTNELNDDDGFVSYDAWGEGVVGDYNFEYNSEQMDYVIDELDKVIKDNDELIISIENEIDNMKNSGAWTGTVYDKFNEKCKFYTNNVLRDYVEILRQMKKNFETVRDNGKHIDDAVKSVKSNVTGD